MKNADCCLHKHTQGTRPSAFDHYGWTGAANGHYVYFLATFTLLIWLWRRNGFTELALLDPTFREMKDYSDCFCTNYIMPDIRSWKISRNTCAAKWMSNPQTINQLRLNFCGTVIYQASLFMQRWRIQYILNAICCQSSTAITAELNKNEITWNQHPYFPISKSIFPLDLN